MLGLGTGEIIIIFILLVLIALFPLTVIFYLTIKNKVKQPPAKSPREIYLAESKLENLDYLKSRNLISEAEYRKRKKLIAET